MCLELGRCYNYHGATGNNIFWIVKNFTISHAGQYNEFVEIIGILVGFKGELKMFVTKSRVALICLLIITVLLAAGCGKKPAAQSKQSPEELKIINQLKEFSQQVEPIFTQAEESYAQLTKAITDFGYSKINKEQLKAIVGDTLNKTRDAKEKIDKVDIPANLIEDLDPVKSGLATAVYLREQKFTKLNAVVQKPNPKSSELNVVLAELKATEAFLIQGKNKLSEAKARYGIE
jgi:regulator of replication initiation timing